MPNKQENYNSLKMEVSPFIFLLGGHFHSNNLLNRLDYRSYKTDDR
jgi:hypothetical protein